MLKSTLYLLFAVSGFAGLIYESIWSHYLKLLLGHAAYAQTLVLALFMGGMALGAWTCSRYSARIRRPLLAYAVVELVLGVLALAFDPLFRHGAALLLDAVAPALGNSIAVDLAKWTFATALILPPCVLLGATFPLISAGVFRLDTASAGRTLGWLYFSNSIGAVAGVLTSGLLLIRLLGLPGTLLTAALLNFFLAFSVWALARATRDTEPTAAAKRADSASTPTLLLIVTFASSAASFCYEIGWIRMLSLVIGSATHSFELMLAAFILGLALGALLIRNRIDRLKRPLATLAGVQVAMGVLALSTLALYQQSFGWMEAIMAVLQPSAGGYSWYLLASAAISMAIMLPAAICAGMTLPLITASLLHGGSGESSIGRVYAANTLGAIVGVLVAVHLLMPLFGARQVILFGGTVDVLLGLWLWRVARPHAPWQFGAVLAACAAGAVFALWPPFDQALLASGVFRHGEAARASDIRYHRDGKTATVHVYGAQDRLSIATNGKIDATLRAGQPSPDDYTMILMAALPLSILPGAQDIAVVGFGSGRSTHSFLQSSGVRSVETIEIEPAMVEGARLFGPAVAAAFEDPRSTIHIDDAKTHFARGNRRYDIIASEPSNPWVSGVASLFTQEFYAQVRRHLKTGGLFVQWLQAYESELPLIASVVGALHAEFADYAIYSSNGFDLIVVAAADGPVPLPGAEALAEPQLAALLDFIGVRRIDALHLRYLGGPATTGRWLLAQGAPANSDFFPFVDQHAARARFRRQSVNDLLEIQPLALRAAGIRPPAAAIDERSGVPALAQLRAAKAVLRVAHWLSGAQAWDADTPLDLHALERAEKLISIRHHCWGPEIQHSWLPSFRSFLEEEGPFLTPDEASGLRRLLGQNACSTSLAAHVDAWLRLLEAVARRDTEATREVGALLLEEALAERGAVPAVLAIELLLADLQSGGTSAIQARAAQLKGRLQPDPRLEWLLSASGR